MHAVWRVMRGAMFACATSSVVTGEGIVRTTTADGLRPRPTFSAVSRRGALRLRESTPSAAVVETTPVPATASKPVGQAISVQPDPVFLRMSGGEVVGSRPLVDASSEPKCCMRCCRTAYRVPLRNRV